MPTFAETQQTSDGYVHTSYETGSEEEKDAKALADLDDYLSSIGNGWKVINDITEQVKSGEVTLDSLNFAFGFAGVTGRPVFAYYRKHFLKEFIKWMNDDPDASKVDEKGFFIKLGTGKMLPGTEGKEFEP